MSTESGTIWGFEDFINRIFYCFQTVVFNHLWVIIIVILGFLRYTILWF